MKEKLKIRFITWYEKKKFKRETISIIGTGNFGIALGKRFMHFGYKVAYGSRSIDYDYVRQCLDLKDDDVYANDSFSVHSIQDSFILSNKLVFIAVDGQTEIYKSIVKKIFENISSNTLIQSNMVEDLVEERIVIDVSNLKTSRHDYEISNAEILESLFETNSEKKFYRVKVVKGFNLISAYKLTENLNKFNNTYSSMLPITGDDSDAKDYLIKFSSKIGFIAYDYGPLKNALNIEKLNLQTFPDWFWPSIFSMGFFIFNSIWIFLYSPLFPRKPNQSYKEFVDYFSLIGHFSRITGFCALQILAYVYLAGIVATFYQLYYGTKYKRFPKFLDSWLKSRKHLGLWAFYFASFHVILSLMYLNPGYLGGFDTWYRKIESVVNITVYDNPYIIPMLTYHAEISMILGIISFLLMALLAITSINSIGSSLNWIEWRFVQSNLGYASLLFGFGHDLSMYLSFVLDQEQKFNYSSVFILTRVMLFLLVVPFIVLFFKFIFSLPFISKHIQNIQNGSYVRSK
jgi:predicted dinucleotide-binding enzyme/DMSO/TMAO reductase YedYZ heme-binding membrane subunit